MLRHILTAYRCYLRLRLRSVARMCCALPMLVKLLFTVVAVAVGYGLVRMEIPHDTVAAGWITAVFVALGMFVCRMGRAELALLAEYRRQGHTVFVASHDVEHLLSYADTLSWLRRGRLAFYPDRAAFDEVRQAIHSEAAEQVRGWLMVND